MLHRTAFESVKAGKTPLLSYKPATDASLFFAELNAYLDKSAMVGGIGDKIAAVVNLCKRLFGCASGQHLELENINGISGHYNRIGTTLGALDLRLTVLTHQRENQVEAQLIATLRLAFEVVGDSGETRSKQAHKVVDTAFPQGFIELSCRKIQGILVFQWQIRRHQIIQKTVFDLFVGEAQDI
jgi:hypothetical protein